MNTLQELRDTLKASIESMLFDIDSNEVALYTTPVSHEDYMEDDAWCTLPATPFYYKDWLYDGTIYELSIKDSEVYVTVLDENSDINHTISIDELYIDQLFELVDLLKK